MNPLEIVLNFINSPPENSTIRILLFIIFFTVMFTGLTRMHFMKENKPILIIISLIISIMATYYMSDYFLQGIISYSYKTIGLGLILIFPLIIILYAMHRNKNSSSATRRIILIIYALIIGFIGYLNQYPLTTVETNIYLFIIGLTIISMFLDKTLNKILKNKYSP